MAKYIPHLFWLYVSYMQYKLNLISTNIIIFNLICHFFFPFLGIIIPIDPVLDLIYSSQDIVIHLKTLNLNNYQVLEEVRPLIKQLVYNWEILDNFFSNYIIEIPEDSFNQEYHMYIKKYLPYFKYLLQK